MVHGLRRERRRRGPDLPGAHQRDQHGMDAGRGLPGVLHAGRLRDARSGLRPFARNGEHPGRGNRRHLHLRRHVLAVGIRLHVLLGNPVDRNHRLHAARTARDLRHDRGSAAGLLGIPVCIRGYLLDGNLGRNDRALRFYRRPALQRRCHRLHLPDHRPLGVGSGWMAREHGSGCIPRLRGFDRGPHHRRRNFTCGRDRAWTPARPRLQARRRTLR